MASFNPSRTGHVCLFLSMERHHMSSSHIWLPSYLDCLTATGFIHFHCTEKVSVDILPIISFYVLQIIKKDEFETTWGWVNEFSFWPKHDSRLLTSAAYYSAANNGLNMCVCFMTSSQRGASLLAAFQVVKMMGEENTCSSPPSVPSLSLCSLERCHLIKPQVLQTGKWKPETQYEVWRNVNELWWEISQCWIV